MIIPSNSTLKLPAYRLFILWDSKYLYCLNHDWLDIHLANTELFRLCSWCLHCSSKSNIQLAWPYRGCTNRDMRYRKKRIDGMYHIVVIIMENTKQDKGIENNGRLIYTGYSWKLFLRDNHLSRDLNEVKKRAKWLSGGILFLADESTFNIYIQ